MIRFENFEETELLKRLAGGDEIAFTKIYNQYWRRLIAMAYSHTKDKFLSEELVQEVFMTLWKNRDAVEIRSLSSYLATAVKFSVFMNITRRNRKKQIIEGISKYNRQIELSHTHLQDELLHAKFLEEFIDCIIEELPDKCKLVYLASRKHHMSTSEIASSMNIATKTVEAHLTKALKMLRLNLKDVLVLVWLLKSR
jgi:RNA polymerase sigma-70 factor (ECF subfamily)